MNYRNLCNSGVKVSVLGLGTNRFGSEKTPQSPFEGGDQEGRDPTRLYRDFALEHLAG